MSEGTLNKPQLERVETKAETLVAVNYNLGNNLAELNSRLSAVLNRLDGRSPNDDKIKSDIEDISIIESLHICNERLNHEVNNLEEMMDSIEQLV